MLGGIHPKRLRARAVGPGRRTARLVELESDLVLHRLGRVDRVAVAAHLLPGVLVELVLAAVGAVRRDRARVAAGLALGDRLELRRDGGRAAGVAAVGRGGDAQAERRQGRRAGDAVGLEAVPLLEALDGALGRAAVL